MPISTRLQTALDAANEAAANRDTVDQSQSIEFPSLWSEWCGSEESKQTVLRLLASPAVINLHPNAPLYGRECWVQCTRDDTTNRLLRELQIRSVVTQGRSDHFSILDQMYYVFMMAPFNPESCQILYQVWEMESGDLELLHSTIDRVVQSLRRRKSGPFEHIRILNEICGYLHPYQRPKELNTDENTTEEMDIYF